MRRSRPLPIETVMAIVVVAVTLVAGVAVLVQGGIDRDGALVATRSSPAAETSTTTASTTSVPDPVAPTTTAPAPPGPDPTTTTTTAAPTTTTSTTEPSTDDVAVECPGLESDIHWRETGDRSALEAAAGTSGRYVEVVTNHSDQPCRLATNRCGSTAELRTADGAATDAPRQACATVHTEVVLEPGEDLREELQVAFPVPPGDYHAHTRGYDGRRVLLPVRLDDRLPACDARPLSLEPHGVAQGRSGEEVRDHGFTLDLTINGADPACSVRVLESRVVLAGPDARIELVDPTERWSAAPAGGDGGIHTHAVAPPTQLEPADYDGTVTLVLAGGGELAAPFRLLVD